METFGGAFFLALARVSGIFLAAPFYSGPAIPVRMKAALAVVLTASLLPALGAPPAGEPGGEAALPAGILGMPLATASELGLGFALGMAGAVVLGAIQTAGHLVAQDIGLTMGGVLDPLHELESSPLGGLKAGLALFIFLAFDLHHASLRLIAESFRLIPPGSLHARLLQAGSGRVLGEAAASQGSILFEGAVRIALPVGATLLLVTVAAAVLGRALPEMNVLLSGSGARAVVGLLALSLSLPLLARAFGRLFEEAARESGLLLKALAGT